MADFPRYDGHLYIDAYEGNIIRDWYVGRDLYVTQDANITRDLVVGRDITSVSGELTLADGAARFTFSDVGATKGLAIVANDPTSTPIISLTSAAGVTILQNTTSGDTELTADNNVKIGYQGRNSTNLYAGAGTDPFAEPAIQIYTLAETGTTFDEGAVNINSNAADMDFIVNTNSGSTFTIDAADDTAEFSSSISFKTNSDVFMKTPTYSTDVNPAVRINAASETYTNKLLTLFTNDFSVETTSYTGVTPALRLNYASDTLTIRPPTTTMNDVSIESTSHTGATPGIFIDHSADTYENRLTSTYYDDVTFTTGTTVDFTGVTVLGLSGGTSSALDGGVTWSNTGTGAPTPDLTVNDGTLTIRTLEFLHDAFGHMEMNINPDSDSDFEFNVYSQNGIPDLIVADGGIGTDGRVTFYSEDIRFHPRPAGDGGTGGAVEYFISDGTKVMEWDLRDSTSAGNKGYRFDVKDSVTGAGKFELNSTGQSDMDFVVNTNTISDAFYIDHGDDSLEFKGVLAAPWPTHNDTEANLATSLTEPGDIAYGTDADELVTRTEITAGSKNYNHFMNSTVQYQFAEDITSWNWGSIGLAYIAAAGVVPNSGSSIGGFVDFGFPEVKPFRVVSTRVNHEDGPDDTTDYNSWRCIVTGELGGSLKTVTSTAIQTGPGLNPPVALPIPSYRGYTYEIDYESRDGYYELVDPTDATEWDSGIVFIGFRRFGSNYLTSTADPPGKTIAAVEIMTYRTI